VGILAESGPGLGQRDQAIDAPAVRLHAVLVTPAAQLVAPGLLEVVVADRG
jgi:hypothetical protein